MGQRLLIVDSDRRFIQDHHSALESSFEVDVLNATDGALSRLDSGLYAAVLVCVEVSENKGYSLCSAIRRSATLSHLKVALISGKATAEEYARHQTLKGRADLYLHKPIHSNALVAALTPLVPMRLADLDNPLGDIGGPDLGDDWLENLRSELEVDAMPPSSLALKASVPEAVAAWEPHLPPEPEMQLELQILPELGDDWEPQFQIEPEAPLTPEAPLPLPIEAAPAPQPPSRPHPSAQGQFHMPLLPLTHQAPQAPALLPRDAGRVELLEARVQDLETKLVATADELDQKTRQAGDLESKLVAISDELDQRALHTEALQAQLGAASSERDRKSREAGDLEAKLAATAEDLEQRTLLTGELEAKLAATAEDLEQRTLLAGELEAKLAATAEDLEQRTLLAGELEAKLAATAEDLEQRTLLAGELEAQVAANAEALEARDQQILALQIKLAATAEDLEQKSQQAMDSMDSNQLLQAQLEELGTDHDRQRMELLAGIEEGEARLAGLKAAHDAQQELIQQLEQQLEQQKESGQGELERQGLDHSARMLALSELLTDLEGKARQALDLTQAPIES